MLLRLCIVLNIALDDKNQYLIMGRNPKNLFTTKDNLYELTSKKIKGYENFQIRQITRGLEVFLFDKKLYLL